METRAAPPHLKPQNWAPQAHTAGRPLDGLRPSPHLVMSQDETAP